ncbi:MAG: porphobilinogen synthase [Actinomycetota bacterium]|nr:porphobilinogen synthase [Actinomycetota bacterium]
MSPFPSERPRRLRASRALRDAFAETRLQPANLIAPLFLKEGLDAPAPIASMPGVLQHTLDSARKEARALAGLGVSGVLLFGVPAHKDPSGTEAHSPTGIIQQSIRALKDEVSEEMIVIADLCLCEYTDHGHCGLLQGYEVDNDSTIEVYGQIACAQAEAGADVVAPSGMMDGQVKAIRGALDGSGFKHTPILSYAVKYASSFYGPFRDAAEGAPRFGDRRSHQQDPANVIEAMREAQLDIDEGADALLVKPALGYLDIVRAVKERFDYPVAAYSVSGEFSMIKAAAANGWLDERAAVLEGLTCMRRAGADLIVTYSAKSAAEWLN